MTESQETERKTKADYRAIINQMGKKTTPGCTLFTHSSPRGDGFGEIPLWPNEEITQPDSRQADKHMQEDIGGSFEDGTVFEEGEGFKSECRIGGKSSKYSYEEKDANVGTE